MSRPIDPNVGLPVDARGDLRCPDCDGRLIVRPLRYRLDGRQHPARPPYCPSCPYVAPPAGQRGA